ncbi:MAG: glycosyltransferase [Phycisphaera sp.]|nr:glycosyltransferase [Phycisphaera sp.]
MNGPVQSVAIVHYHLRSAGVTRVIGHAAEALRRRGVQVVVLSGEPAVAGVEVIEHAEIVVLGGLGYDETRAAWEERELAERMRAAAAKALGGPPDLWHVHNHSLGKNVALPGAVKLIAEDGERVLYQPHDFAEDGRPANYGKLLDHAGGDHAALGAALYPVADHVHYVTLNTRDHGHLVAAGLDASHVHVLPNAVDLDVDENPAEAHAVAFDEPVERFFLYPTRAIRRKNVGELLLWSAMAEPGDRFATTLAPKSPADLPIYDAWKRFASERDLPVWFEVGTSSDASFLALLRSATALVTTSVAEGFGMAFLEPWLVGQPLVGRNLPSITADFAETGVDLSPLYERLDVPIGWIGEDTLRDRVRDKLGEVYGAYRQPLSDGAVDAVIASMVRDGRVDFGRIDESMQRTVIARVLDDAAARGQITPPRLVGDSPDAGRIAANQRAVRERFSLDAYAKRLLGLYAEVAASPRSGLDSVSAERVLQRFLGPDEFNLLRT